MPLRAAYTIALKLQRRNVTTPGDKKEPLGSKQIMSD